MSRISRGRSGRVTAGVAGIACMACWGATLGLSLLAGCSGKKEAAMEPPVKTRMKYPVEVVSVKTGSVEYTVQAVGSIEAFEKVAVTARVPGVVEKVRFQEGDLVGPQNVLAEIEPERFRLAVDSARADLNKFEAAKDEARLGLERRQMVNAKNPDLVRAEEVDAWRTRLTAAEAEAAHSKAALELATLNLRDALVRPPAAGIIQTREVETGRYVQPGAVIATLVRRDPLLLRFRVPELEASSLSPGMSARFALRGNREAQHTATLTLVSASADPRDRMVEVTGKVDNPSNGELRPGSFAEVTVAVGSPSTSPVVPQTAIRPSERGFLAYVIDGDVAHERILELGLRTADGRVEVRSGLAAGDQLVVRGAEALSEGAAVTITAEKQAGSTEPAPKEAAP